MPIALQLAGVATVIAHVLGGRGGLRGAVGGQLLRGAAARPAPRVDLAALVQRTNDELRAMTAAAARERLLALADAAGDPFAAMELEAYAHRLARSAVRRAGAVGGVLCDRTTHDRVRGGRG